MRSPIRPDGYASLLLALVLCSICFLGAFWIVHRHEERASRISHSSEDGIVLPHESMLHADFVRQNYSPGVSWRLEGELISSRLTREGLRLVSSSDDESPRLVLGLEGDARDYTLLELYLTVNKGTRGFIRFRRYPGDAGKPGADLSFPLNPGAGRHTYRVRLDTHPDWKGPLHELVIQLADMPVRATIAGVRLERNIAVREARALRDGTSTAVMIREMKLRANAPSPCGFYDMMIHVGDEGSTIQCALGLHPSSRQLGDKAASFDVQLIQPGTDSSVLPEEKWECLYRKVLDPGRREDRRWVFHGIDLSPWAGERIRIRFRSGILDRGGREGNGPDPGPSDSILPLWGPSYIRHLKEGGDTAPPGLVLIILDTVGRNELGVYGGTSGLTPALDKVFSNGLVVRNAYSVDTGLEQFYQSLFHGSYPPGGGVWSATGDHTPSSLVSLLRRSGFRTAAFFTGGKARKLMTLSGPAGGFEFIGRADGELDLLQSQELETPERGGEFEPGPLTWLHWVTEEPFLLTIHIDGGVGGRNGHFERLRALDRAVARIVSTLRRLGREEQTVFCVTSIRGSQDPWRIGETSGLFEETVGVPLMFRHTGDRWACNRDSIIRSIDLLPTLCEAVDLEPGEEGRMGLSLLPWFKGQAGGPWPVDEVYLSAVRSPSYRVVGIRRNQYKILWRLLPRSALACYDVEEDPSERENLWPPGAGGKPGDADHISALFHRLKIHFGGVQPVGH